MEPMKPSANRIEVKAMRLSHGLGLPLPQYQTEEAAGLDLLAAVPLTSPLRLLPGMRQLVPTGLTVEIPPGFEGQVRPRSGLALNHGVTVLNSPGTVDSDYRGEIKVLLINLGRETFVITRGQRIAQMVISPVARAELIDVRAVAASRRGEGGFGSTGLAASSETVRIAPPPAPRAPIVPKIPVVPAVVIVAPSKPAPIKAVPIKTTPIKPAAAKPVAVAKSAVAAKAPPASANNAPNNAPNNTKAKKPAPPPAASSAAKKGAPGNVSPAKASAGKVTPGKAAPAAKRAAVKPAAKAPAVKAPAIKSPAAKRPVVSTAKAKVPARA
jgi:dUTP pyrophosphatase